MNETVKKYFFMYDHIVIIIIIYLLKMIFLIKLVCDEILDKN